MAPAAPAARAVPGVPAASAAAPTVSTTGINGTQSFLHPIGLVMDATGNVFLADTAA